MGSRMKIPIPKDERGMIGRECPQSACEGYFKLKPGTGLTGPGLTCTCPYCGHTSSPDQFWTKEQIEYAKSVALREVASAVLADLKSLEFDHKPKGPFGIGISLKVKAGRPHPIRYYREKELETSVVCSSCTLEYSVYGVFGFCPDCAAHNSAQILERNLDLIKRQVGLANTLEDPDLRRHLLDDALENLVSSFDGFGRETCRVRATFSSDPARCENVSFQNLSRAATVLHKLFNVDIASGVDPTDWQAANRAFMQRHVLAHKAGVIDQQYLDETGESPALLGRKVSPTSEEVLALVGVMGRIGKGLLGLLPQPR